MRQVTIGFSSPNKWKPGAELIKLWQGGTSYSHVYIKSYSSWLNKNLIYQASHGMVNCIEESTFLLNNKITDEFQLDRTDNQFKDAISICVDLLGRPYGYLGLLVVAGSQIIQGLCQLLNLSSKFLNTWGDGLQTLHCSEFVAAIFPEVANYTDKNPDRIEPVDMYNAICRFKEASNG